MYIGRKIVKKERVLNLRDITKTYLEVNRWSIADMAYLIGMPRSTLSEWMSGKRDLTERNMRHVKAFLNGDYVKDVSAVINYILITQDIEKEEIDEYED